MAPSDKFSQTGVLKDKFRSLDKDHNGWLDFDEMLKLLRDGNAEMTDALVRRLFTGVDKNHDGKVSFDEFVDYILSSGNSNSPGPAAHVGDDTKLAQHKNAPKATIGQGPGHHVSADVSDTPGPASYDIDDTKESHHKAAPKATIGKGEGHKSLASTEVTPGPYNTSAATKEKVKGGNYMGTSHGGPRAGTGPVRAQFKKSDADKNGLLDREEVMAVMTRGNPDIKDRDVDVIFKALDADKSGGVDFEELVGFLFDSTSTKRNLQNKLKDAFLNTDPGPGRYDTRRSRDKQEHVQGGSFGKASGHPT